MCPRLVLLAGLVAAQLLVASMCPARLPDQMNYQAMLTDDLDQPLVNQSIEMTFRIYDQESGGTLYWSETQNVETNSIGVVTVAMGSVNPFGYFTFGPQWLEVEINGEIMEPRRQLLEAPFARAAGFADEALSASELDYVSADQYALYSVLSNPGAINTPTNPLEWTRLKNVPAGFADGVDDAGTGDGHSLDASDGNPTDVVRVDADGMVEAAFSSELADVMNYWGYYYALTVGAANVWGGILAETKCELPFATAILAGATNNAGVLGAAYDTTGQMSLIDGKSGVAGSVYGEGYAGSFIADDMEGDAIYCANTGGGNVLHAHCWGTTGGYTGHFEGGSGVLIERYSGIPALDVDHFATSGWGDAAYFSSGSGVSFSTWTINSTCYQGTAGRFSKAVDDDAYAVIIAGTGSTSEGLYVDGTILSTGSVARAVETSRGPRPIFGVSSPDVEVVASGTGRLTRGTARVEFGDVFSESITGSGDLRVTATPVGGWSALYVERKDASGFSLRSDAGDMNVEFDWVAVGRCLGQEERPQLTIPDPTEDARVAEAKEAEIAARRPERRDPPRVIRGKMP